MQISFVVFFIVNTVQIDGDIFGDCVDITGFVFVQIAGDDHGPRFFLHAGIGKGGDGRSVFLR